jgi:hypothetical protein
VSLHWWPNLLLIGHLIEFIILGAPVQFIRTDPPNGYFREVQSSHDETIFDPVSYSPECIHTRWSFALSMPREKHAGRIGNCYCCVPSCVIMCAICVLLATVLYIEVCRLFPWLRVLLSAKCLRYNQLNNPKTKTKLNSVACSPQAN